MLDTFTSLPIAHTLKIEQIETTKHSQLNKTKWFHTKSAQLGDVSAFIIKCEMALRTMKGSCGACNWGPLQPCVFVARGIRASRQLPSPECNKIRR